MMKHSTKIQNDATITLWGLGISPYVRKVVAALEEKALNYRVIETLPKSLLEATGQEVADDFDQASPLGKIPALEVGGVRLADSAVIASYLDCQFPLAGSKLYPSEPEAYAKALWFEKYADTTLSDVAYRNIFVECVVKPNVLGVAADQAIVKQAIDHQLPPLLDYLDHAVSENNWLAGDDFSMADIAVTTQMLALQMAGFALDQADRWPALQQHLQRVIARPSFASMIA
jgi:glutathione S-transferase